ncbi:MAG: MATE family efflux transporter, partial [Gemmatimonadales bacterium]
GLALPIVGVQLGWMLMGLVDTLMVGRLSAQALAGVALGNLYFMSLSAFGLGLLMALDPLVAQARGAADETGVARAVQRGLVVAAAVSLPVSLALLPAAPVFRLLGQPAEVVPIAAGYVLACLPGLLPMLWFIAFRQSLQALGRVRPVLLAVAAANVANVFLNWVFVYGKLGAPALGAVGTGVASTICRILMCGAIVAAGWPLLGPRLRPWRRESFAVRPLLRVFSLGAPVGLMTMLEFMAFGATGLLMGLLGTTPMAGHQIEITLASFTFMVPLGIAASGSVLVGHAIGRGDLPGARRESGATLLLGVGFMTLSALVFLLIPRVLAGAFTTDAAVLAVAAMLLPIAGVFQVFDGIQVVSAGLLRGMGDTRYPMLGNVIGFWVLGIPAGVLFTFGFGWGPKGLWWGCVVGLASVAVLLLARTGVLLQRGVVRVRVDDDTAEHPVPAPEPA